MRPVGNNRIPANEWNGDGVYPDGISFFLSIIFISSIDPNHQYTELSIPFPRS